jgi:hypothetical protein
MNNTHILYLVGITNTPVFCGGFSTREEAIAEGKRREPRFWPINPHGCFYRYYVE